MMNRPVWGSGRQSLACTKGSTGVQAKRALQLRGTSHLHPRVETVPRTRPPVALRASWWTGPWRNRTSAARVAAAGSRAALLFGLLEVTVAFPQPRTYARASWALVEASASFHSRSAPHSRAIFSNRLLCLTHVWRLKPPPSTNEARFLHFQPASALGIPGPPSHSMRSGSVSGLAPGLLPPPALSLLRHVLVLQSRGSDAEQPRT